MNERNANENIRRILGRVAPHDFVGRADELQRVIAQTSRSMEGRGLLLLMEPSAGVSELLRQAYDQLFNQRSEVIPIYFAFTRNARTAVSGAIEFLNTFLQQYIAHRRNESAVSYSSFTLQDLVELAPPTDVQWLEQLLESYSRLRFSNDDQTLVRFCLNAPHRIPPSHGRPFVMLDGAQLAEFLNGSVMLGSEVLRVFSRGGVSFAMAGLRRQILAAAHEAECDFETIDSMRLEQLPPDQAGLLVDYVAKRQHVATSKEAHDLLVQQFAGSPFFINSILLAAREKNVALISYLDCQRLYVDELLGGHIHRHFSALLEEIVPRFDIRQLLIRLLWEAAAGEEQTSSLETWRKRLHVETNVLEEILRRLHVQEFVNWDGATVDAGTGPQVWKDYLKVRYRLDVMNEPRALVLADALSDALKRAPHTMARHYRQIARQSLRELVLRFDCQRVPAILFDNEQFNRKYKGVDDDDVVLGLAAEADFLRLPQTVHAAHSLAFNSDMRQVCDAERCVVAHTFADAIYTDARQVVWLIAEIESKLEVEKDVAELWLARLESLAERFGFKRYQVWLISNEGFSPSATKALSSRGAYTSSSTQLDLLASRLGEAFGKGMVSEGVNEFLMVVPMGEDNELVAASAVEQVARRLTFRPEAINQIKTAIVEACINAAEHSFSPDRKIYQRFRVEDDKLVITISSRGIVPANLSGTNTGGAQSDNAADERRGWGLKLIRTLMDEVEFERVDEGTSLRMTKYLRSGVTPSPRNTDN